MQNKRISAKYKSRKKMLKIAVSLLCLFSLLLSLWAQGTTTTAQELEDTFTMDGVTYQIGDDHKLYVIGFDQEKINSFENLRVQCDSQYRNYLTQRVYDVGGIEEGAFSGLTAGELVCKMQGDYVIGKRAFADLMVAYIYDASIAEFSVYFEAEEGCEAKLTEIGEEAFAGARVYNNFTIATSVGSIGARAFKNAYINGTLKLEKEVESIGDHAFDGLTVSRFSWTDDVKKIGDGAFANIKFNGGFAMPANLQVLGSQVFADCEGLKKIYLPDGNCIREVAPDAFPDQEGVTIIIPSTVTNLSVYHFENYHNTVFQLPEDTGEDSALLVYLKSIGVKYQIGAEGEVMQGQPSQETTLPPAETGNPEPTTSPTVEPEKSATPAETETPEPTTSPTVEPEKSATPAVTGSPEPATSPTVEPEKSAIPAETGNPSASIGTGATTSPAETTALPSADSQGLPGIGERFQVKKAKYRVIGKNTVVFAGLVPKNVSKIVIPETVTYQGRLFQVTGIADRACRKQKKLQSAVIGDSVTKVGNQAFAGCSSLTKVVFGEQVTTLGKKVLYRDKKLKKITFRGKKLQKIGSKSFTGVPRKAKIVVPKSKMKAYQIMINRS